MGNMVNVSILTDRWQDVAANPDRLIAAIAYGMHGELDYPFGEHSLPGVTVHRYHHADHVGLYAEWKNVSLDLLDRNADRWKQLLSTEHGREFLSDIVTNMQAVAAAIEHAVELGRDATT